jgi:hypothetical protein
MCGLFKAYTYKSPREAIGDRLQASSCLSRVEHNWEIRATKQRKDVGIYSFVNRIITDWNQLPEVTIGALIGNTYSFRKRVRIVRRSEGNKSEVNGSEVLIRKLK